MNCNFILQEYPVQSLNPVRLFTLTNSGMARNCSLTAVLTPPNLKLIQFGIGKPTSYIGLSSLVSLFSILWFIVLILESNQCMDIS